MMNKFEAITEALKQKKAVFSPQNTKIVPYYENRWSIKELQEEGWSVEGEKPEKGCCNCGFLGKMKYCDSESPFAERFDNYCSKRGESTDLNDYCPAWKEKVKAPEVPLKLSYNTIDREIINGLVDCVEYLMDERNNGSK